MKRQTCQRVMAMITIATLALAIAPRRAQANSIATFVTEPQAQGLTGSGATVTVWPGSGTNIDFTRTGEVVERAWLDDPSRLTLDFDGSLSSNSSDGGNSGSSGNTSSAGASIVHLRRIVGVHFPNLPSTATTLLTVVTRSAAGTKEYLFQVHYGSGSPQYAAVIVTPNAAGVGAQGGVEIAGSRTANWDDVDRGLQTAIHQQLIASNSPVIARVQGFLAQVRNGTPMNAALTQTNVSAALISRLATIGYGVPRGASQP